MMSYNTDRNGAPLLERLGHLEHVAERHDKALEVLMVRVAQLEQVIGSGDPTEARLAEAPR